MYDTDSKYSYVIFQDRLKYIPHDQHELAMFTPLQYLESMRLAKLEPRFVKAEKPEANSLYLATK